MPELPEVEGLSAFLNAKLAGRLIGRIDVASMSVLKTVDPPLASLEGMRIEGVHRAGKFLVVDAGSASLVIHLALAGWVTWRDDPPAGRPGKGPLAMRLVAVSDAGEVVGGFDLTEAGTRKAAAVYAVHDPVEVPGIARLGPDALEVEEDTFAHLLAAQGRAQIKGVLRDQSVIAGIGNAYSDEILHAARTSPFANADSVAAADVFAAMRDVLVRARDAALDTRVALLKAEKKSTLRIHGRAGQPCPECADTIRSVSFADRSLEYCPTCQTSGKVLSDRRMSRLLK